MHRLNLNKKTKKLFYILRDINHKEISLESFLKVHKKCSITYPQKVLKKVLRVSYMVLNVYFLYISAKRERTSFGKC